MVFNVVALKRDDHAKQHSLLHSPEDRCRLSPAYDLTFSNGPGGEHYLAVNGKRRDVGPKDVGAVAKRQGIRNAGAIVEEVVTNVATLPETAKGFGVSADTIKQIKGPIEKQPAAFR